MSKSSDTESSAQPTANQTEPNRRKIGLALSGGGFRASIFHLGVIRRLEELGIMKDVDVISTVSGGSIIGAYYACEMEKGLRKERSGIDKDPSSLDRVRLKLFEKIAERFFTALRHNMRTRALVFSPFYHPILFIKSLWPGVSRSDIIQAEYDVHLFDGTPLLHTGETIGDLPSAMSHKSGANKGPKLVINATSLLTGNRVSLSRQTISGVSELEKSNENAVPLARAVGASACVPGLFPPTKIAGDMLVDGGVSDNQGVDGLLEDGLAKGEEYELIIVSDASGQLARLDSASPKAMAVLGRSMGIFQHEIRKKGIKILIDWMEETNLKLELKPNDKPKASFAYVHLFLDLKDRGSTASRVPSEYISPLGRIRTDLDQFSMIEREALMYHGYTLIDAQLLAHCEEFLKGRKMPDGDVSSMRRPPLFTDRPSTESSSAGGEIQQHDRRLIKRELVAGATGLFVFRSIIKFPYKAGPLVGACWLIPLIPYFLFAHGPVAKSIKDMANDFVDNYVNCYVPGWVKSAASWIFGGDLPSQMVHAATTVIAILGEVFIISYLLALLTYVLARWRVFEWDGDRYHNFTGKEYSTKW